MKYIYNYEYLVHRKLNDTGTYFPLCEIKIKVTTSVTKINILTELQMQKFERANEKKNEEVVSKCKNRIINFQIATMTIIFLKNKLV